MRVPNETMGVTMALVVKSHPNLEGWINMKGNCISLSTSSQPAALLALPFSCAPEQEEREEAGGRQSRARRERVRQVPVLWPDRCDHLGDEATAPVAGNLGVSILIASPIRQRLLVGIDGKPEASNDHS